MLYKIISAFTSDELERKVQSKLNEGWHLHGMMTSVVFEKEVKFYQSVTKTY